MASRYIPHQIIIDDFELNSSTDFGSTSFHPYSFNPDLFTPLSFHPSIISSRQLAVDIKDMFCHN